MMRKLFPNECIPLVTKKKKTYPVEKMSLLTEARWAISSSEITIAIETLEPSNRSLCPFESTDGIRTWTLYTVADLLNQKSETSSPDL